MPLYAERFAKRSLVRWKGRREDIKGRLRITEVTFTEKRGIIRSFPPPRPPASEKERVEREKKDLSELIRDCPQILSIY